MSPLDYYPWQLAEARQWLSQTERFAHAWLIHGLTGIGKVQFAKAAAAALLCEQPQSGVACGQCVSCHWICAGNHPDLRWIRPESYQVLEDPELVSSKTPSKHIRVEQLRGLSDWFHTATHRGGYRVAVLYPAESLNAISANALLKILEEPMDKTLFLLVTHNYQALLPTILSRCRRLGLALPSLEQSLDWLKTVSLDQPETWLAAVGGAPVAAWNAAQEQESACPPWLVQLAELCVQNRPKAIIGLAEQLETESTAQWLDRLQRFYVDMQFTLLGQAPRYYPALSAFYQQLVLRHSALGVQQQWKWLVAQKKQAHHPLNAKLLIHTALERVAQYCA